MFSTTEKKDKLDDSEYEGPLPIYLLNSVADSTSNIESPMHKLDFINSTSGMDFMTSQKISTTAMTHKKLNQDSHNYVNIIQMPKSEIKTTRRTANTNKSDAPSAMNIPKMKIDIQHESNTTALLSQKTNPPSQKPIRKPSNKDSEAGTKLAQTSSNPTNNKSPIIRNVVGSFKGSKPK